MKIEILGKGCPKCKYVEDNARKAVAEKGINADIVKVTDFDEIIKRGITSTPAIVIDGQLKAYGRIVSSDEIKKWL